MLKLASATSVCSGVRAAHVWPIRSAKLSTRSKNGFHARPAPRDNAQPKQQPSRFKHVCCSSTSDDLGAGSSGRGDAHDEFLEVRVESLRAAHGFSVVLLRVVGSDLLLPLTIGEAESSALHKELNNIKPERPITHDLTKNLLLAAGFMVTKIKITELESSTFFSRVHLAKPNFAGSQVEFEDEVDIDARPSDAINLAMRFGAPMFVAKKIVDVAAKRSSPNPDGASAPAANNVVSGLALLAGVESNADIVSSCRQTLSTFEDPTVMYELYKAMAIQRQRFEDAAALQRCIFYEATHNATLRVVVAMEAALQDGRYEEAASLREDYQRLTVAAGSTAPSAP